MYFHRFTNLRDHPKTETKHILKLKKRMKIDQSWSRMMSSIYIHTLFLFLRMGSMVIAGAGVKSQLAFFV